MTESDERQARREAFARLQSAMAVPPRQRPEGFTNPLEKIEELLSCPICLDRFKCPRLLPCQHSFCSDCLDGVVDIARRSLKCPECRAEHQLPYDGVKGFQINYTLTGFLEIHLNASEDNAEQLEAYIRRYNMERCKVCDEKAEVVLCGHCDKRVCPECKQSHLDMTKRDLGRLINQVKRLSNRITEASDGLAKSIESLKLNCAVTRDEIKDYVRRYMKELKRKEDHFVGEIESFYSAEVRLMRTVRDALELESSNINEACARIEAALKVTWRNCGLAIAKQGEREMNEDDLVFYKNLLVEGLDYLRGFHPDADDLFSKKVRFAPGSDAAALPQAISNFGEVTVCLPQLGGRWEKLEPAYAPKIFNIGMESDRYKTRVHRDGVDPNDMNTWTPPELRGRNNRNRPANDEDNSNLRHRRRQQLEEEVWNRLRGAEGRSPASRHGDESASVSAAAKSIAELVQGSPFSKITDQAVNDKSGSSAAGSQSNLTASATSTTDSKPQGVTAPAQGVDVATNLQAPQVGGLQRSKPRRGSSTEDKALNEKVESIRREHEKKKQQAPTIVTPQPPQPQQQQQQQQPAKPIKVSASAKISVPVAQASKDGNSESDDDTSEEERSDVRSPVPVLIYDNSSLRQPANTTSKADQPESNRPAANTTANNSSGAQPPKQSDVAAASTEARRRSFATDDNASDAGSDSRRGSMLADRRERHKTIYEPSSYSSRAARLLNSNPFERPQPSQGTWRKYLIPEPDSGGRRPAQHSATVALSSVDGAASDDEAERQAAGTAANDGSSDSRAANGAIEVNPDEGDAGARRSGVDSSDWLDRRRQFTRSRTNPELIVTKSQARINELANGTAAADTATPRYGGDAEARRNRFSTKQDSSETATDHNDRTSALQSDRRTRLRRRAVERATTTAVDDASGADSAGGNNPAPLQRNVHPRIDYALKDTAGYKFGGKGANDGEFNWPRGLAMMPDTGELIVCDSSNHRLQVFTKRGAFVRAMGAYGSGRGQFDCLADCAATRFGQLYVTDRYNHRVQVLEAATGCFVREFGSHGQTNGKFNNPWGVTVDNQGFVYVCDKDNHRVQIFQADGKFVGKFGSMGTREGTFHNPHFIAATRSGQLVVTDSGNHRVQIFDMNGHFIHSFGSEGFHDGQFKYPRGVAVDEQGFITIADSGNNRVQVFYPDGRFLHAFGTWGSADGQLKGVEAVVVTAEGRVIVSDRENHRIQAF